MKISTQKQAPSWVQDEIPTRPNQLLQDVTCSLLGGFKQQMSLHKSTLHFEGGLDSQSVQPLLWSTVCDLNRAERGLTELRPFSVSELGWHLRDIAACVSLTSALLPRLLHSILVYLFEMTLASTFRTSDMNLHLNWQLAVSMLEYGRPTRSFLCVCVTVFMTNLSTFIFNFSFSNTWDGMFSRWQTDQYI